MADEKAFYQVLSPLKHDGKLYMPAKSETVKVKLSAEEAESLKALGIVGDLPPGTSDDTGKGKPAKDQK